MTNKEEHTERETENEEQSVKKGGMREKKGREDKLNEFQRE